MLGEGPEASNYDGSVNPLVLVLAVAQTVCQ